MIADSIPFEEWALLQRERLRRQALDIFAQLAENALHHSEPDSALHYAGRQLVLDAWRESAHRQQMRALLLSGQRNAAITHYDDLRRTLAADLGVEPEAETVELAEMLKSDTVATPTLYLVGTGNYDLPPEPGEPPFMGLQHFDVGDADRFFGREALTADLLQQLIPDGDSASGGASTAGGESTIGGFLAIVGASGSGKSSLVRAGLTAAIRRGDVIPGSENWAVHLITPTAHPLEALALSLTRDSESVTAAATLMDDMAQDARSLQLFLRRDVACNVSTHRRYWWSTNSRNSSPCAAMPTNAPPSSTTCSPQLLPPPHPDRVRVGVGATSSSPCAPTSTTTAPHIPICATP